MRVSVYRKLARCEMSVCAGGCRGRSSFSHSVMSEIEKCKVRVTRFVFLVNDTTRSAKSKNCVGHYESRDNVCRVRLSDGYFFFCGFFHFPLLFLLTITLSTERFSNDWNVCARRWWFMGIILILTRCRQNLDSRRPTWIRVSIKS